MLSLCQRLVCSLGPLVVDTGAGFDWDNYQDVIALAEQGIR